MLDPILPHYKIIFKLGEGGWGLIYKTKACVAAATSRSNFSRPHLNRDAQALERYQLSNGKKCRRITKEL